jgi:hypothetical protein
MCIEFWKNMKGRHHLEDLDRWQNNFKTDFIDTGWKVQTGFMWLSKGASGPT